MRSFELIYIRLTYEISKNNNIDIIFLLGIICKQGYRSTKELKN